MALGVPTIVFADGGGLVEHVEDDETGFIVANQRELEATLTRLVADRAFGERVGARGAAETRERYTPQRSAAVYRELYRNALHRAAGRCAWPQGSLASDSAKVA